MTLVDEVAAHKATCGRAWPCFVTDPAMRRTGWLFVWARQFVHTLEPTAHHPLRVVELELQTLSLPGWPGPVYLVSAGGPIT